MAAPAEIVESVQEAGLVYTTDQMPGIQRVRKGDQFEYIGPDGKKIVDEAVLQRIRSLAIPPAYENVWICADPNGHLQATGRDARGRKQYRYHPRFRELRDENKYERLIEFGECLPEIHRRMQEDMSKRKLTREKVLATVLYLLEKSLIRVGNEEYAQENKHYGLTTLRRRHVKVDGDDVKFNFLGKSGVRHRITLKDRRIARVVSRLQELPGQELFKYVDDDGVTHTITSSDVNAYLKEISGRDFTAKDFRTWAGTVLALTQLLSVEPPSTKKHAKTTVSAVLKVVAGELGNTPAVCRKCYVHPAVLDCFAQGTLQDFIFENPEIPGEAVADVVECAEDAVVRLLRRYSALRKAA